jgi:hypothetical protein
MRSNRNTDEMVGEAIAAIGPMKAYIARKRAELQAQIAQVQTSQAALSGMSIFHPVTQVAEVSALGAEVALAPKDAEGNPTTGALPAATNPAKAEEPASGSPHLNLSSALATTVPDLAAPPTPAEGGTPRTATEAQAALDRALSPQVVATLHPTLQQAWKHRQTDPVRWSYLLISADEAKVLPDAVAEAVAGLVEWDNDFRDAFAVFVSGRYPELFEAEWKQADEEVVGEDEQAVGDEAEEGKAGRAVGRGEAPF